MTLKVYVYRAEYTKLIRNVTSISRHDNTVEIIYRTESGNRENLHLSTDTDFVVMVDHDSITD